MTIDLLTARNNKEWVSKEAKQKHTNSISQKKVTIFLEGKYNCRHNQNGSPTKCRMLKNMSKWIQLKLHLQKLKINASSAEFLDENIFTEKWHRVKKMNVYPWRIGWNLPIFVTILSHFFVSIFSYHTQHFSDQDKLSLTWSTYLWKRWLAKCIEILFYLY